MKNPDANAYENNPFCGDKIEIDVKIKNKEQRTKNRIIEDIKFRAEGCAISMASASMLTERVLGKNIKDIKKLNTEDILEMLGITLTPTRLKCALLPLEVLHKTLALVKSI